MKDDNLYNTYNLEIQHFFIDVNGDAAEKKMSKMVGNGI